MIYSHRKIEQKWQKIWLNKKLFATDLHDYQKPKLYLLDMFPYPSGSGLHVGHLRGYLATDVLTRMKRMQGFNVLHPIGFDSFGLPAEQYAIRTKKDPLLFTEKNIAYFYQQLQSFGFAYDYDRVVRTHDPQYYKWTQWIFLRLFNQQLAFLADTEVNYCPALNTVLANEEVINLDGRIVSEREEHPVFRQQRKQWMLKITNYAQHLLTGLKTLDWPDAVKKAQINWIGRKSGFLCKWTVQEFKNVDYEVPLFRLSDLMVVEFIVLQLNNSLLDRFLSQTVLTQLKELRHRFAQKPVTPDGILDKQPVGLFSRLTTTHLLLTKEVPIFFAEYVGSQYSYQIKLGLPQLDVQDWFFAKNHRILNDSQLNIAKKGQQQINEDQLFVEKKYNLLVQQRQIVKSVFYELRDWIFARQRYWGEPFPVRYHDRQVYSLSPEQLPLLLPKVSNLKLLFTKKSTPLANIKEWVDSGYDVNTMPQWAGSCWYFLAYLLKKNDGTFWPLNSVEAKEILNYWMPVDLYIGGAEHAVLHLLYARFWNRFLVDIDCYNHAEPFQKLRNPGLVLAADGKKMSKSKNNFVDPNSFLLSHGADAVRLYQKFIGPFDKSVSWNERGLDAMRKWLGRVYRLFVEKQNLFVKAPTPHLQRIYATTVQKVTENYTNLSFNVAISQLMVFINHCYKSDKINFEYGLGFLKLLYPVCPHLSEEIWSLWKQEALLIEHSWPTYRANELKLENVVFAIQINGKTKKTLSLPIDLDKNAVVALAKKKVSFYLRTNEIKKIIFIANKIVNFVC